MGLLFISFLKQVSNSDWNEGKNYFLQFFLKTFFELNAQFRSTRSILRQEYDLPLKLAIKALDIRACHSVLIQCAAKSSLERRQSSLK